MESEGVEVRLRAPPDAGGPIRAMAAEADGAPSGPELLSDGARLNWAEFHSKFGNSL